MLQNPVNCSDNVLTEGHNFNFGAILEHCKPKQVFIRDAKAVRLIQYRAETENRSLANAAAQTIIEALGERFNGNNTITKNTKRQE